MARLRRSTGATALDLAVVVFVAAVTGWGVFEDREHISTPIAGPRWLTVPVALLIALPLLWRRRRPLLICGLVLSGIVIQAVATGNSPEGLQLIIVWVLVPYSVAAYSERRGALIGLALVLAAFAVYAVDNHDIASGRADDLWSGAFFLILAVGAWLAGMVQRSRREAAALTAQADALEREAEVAVANERSRMAREFHDIVSHNLSVVVVQAAGARAVADGHGSDPAALEKIERSGREALVEMRQLLGVLREDDRADSGLAPQPGIGELPALAERVRGAGVAVELTVDEECASLAPALGLSAYRIVQEALTNTLKHAGRGALARVEVHRDAGTLTIEIADGGGQGEATEPAGAGGHGLAGMRERVTLLGGDLEAGTRLDGGYGVRVRLPLDGARRP